jgi:hypothetical protein
MVRLKDIAIMVIAYLVICAIGLYMYMEYAEVSGVYLKAKKYDYYKTYTDQIENCTSLPMILCSSGSYEKTTT